MPETKTRTEHIERDIFSKTFIKFKQIHLLSAMTDKKIYNSTKKVENNKNSQKQSTQNGSTEENNSKLRQEELMATIITCGNVEFIWECNNKLLPSPNDHGVIPFETSDEEAIYQISVIYLSIKMVLNISGQDVLAKKKLYNAYFSFWSVTKESIATIAKTTLELDPNGELLEIGSGRGLSALFLSQYPGIKMFPTDIKPRKETFTTIEIIDVIDAIKKYKDAKTMLLAWPPMLGQFGEDMSYKAITNFNGNQIIYIGEPDGCCTGHPTFFEVLREKWVLKRRLPIPRFTGIIDSLYIYYKKL